MRIAELADRRVAVWGCGREGRAALAALYARLPSSRPTLFCSEAEARALAAERAEAAQAIGSVDIVTTPPDAAALSAFDVVIKSPGISAYKPEILEARRNGTRFTSGTALWFAEHPQARVIAVTGTKGKSTVTATIAHLLRASGRRVALAGNIGLPLLELLDPPQAPDWWVVELSSFQTREATRVDVAVINNLYEEHLDWHGTRERYAEDKLALAAVARIVVANATQTSLLAPLAAHPQVLGFGGADGWHVAGGAIRHGDRVAFDLARSPLPGPHNALNLCAALAALEAAGLVEESGQEGPLLDRDRQAAQAFASAAAASIATFRPLPHRLQTLGEHDGLVWVDDSIATTPQATLEALLSLAGRAVTVLVGGYERGLDWRGFAEQVRAQPPQAIVAMGANRARIAAQLRDVGGAYRLEEAASVEDAVRAARALTPPGGVVLLSPGAPSFDQFKDYAERGRRFAELAGFDPLAIGAIEGLGIA
ncbi:UDP-N-acetylmuramoyl-L-alanine--D-glutamate ligase [Dokdonella sp.]|uniref:UDP-N-acetylmuramoyl-L-alanine--D-glutamate ligase n=1 Tax=Dokdonella sp. TaxID=2291710 RepID=UPI001B0D625E|nr:UDP-N-acetylmuramoyl-L-alanine--D-glutamate ligase [Dokdonella sp.]MBO9663780.1 UDP-N-acetylmuramoyl-L-alanine--D-glutamate ligase [Dokdonella sp.]